MRCPFCDFAETNVRDSRPAEEGSTIRRRRACPKCGGRFTTFERVEMQELRVVKNNNRTELFSRDKLKRSLLTALRKRPVEEEQVDNLVTAIVRDLEKRGDTDIPSRAIGELVMSHLKKIDPVGYVRYASVYKDFRETEDFKEFIGTL
jgi:transcriptional repressor NrdR